MKAELASLKELVEKMTTAEKPNVQEEQPSPVNNGVDAEAVAKLIQDQFSQREAQTVAKQNMDQVANALTSKYGDKAQEVINSKARELGTTPEALGNLASQNPNMVLAYFNSGSPPQSVTSPGNISPLAPEPEPELERPSRSLLTGARSKDQMDYMAKIRERVYKRHGVVT